jgi:hypothetical protein
VVRFAIAFAPEQERYAVADDVVRRLTALRRSQRRFPNFIKRLHGSSRSRHATKKPFDAYGFPFAFLGNLENKPKTLKRLCSRFPSRPGWCPQQARWCRLGFGHAPGRAVTVDPSASLVTDQVARRQAPPRTPGPLRLPSRRAHRRSRPGNTGPSDRSGLGNGLRASSSRRRETTMATSTGARSIRCPSWRAIVEEQRGYSAPAVRPPHIGVPPTANAG